MPAGVNDRDVDLFAISQETAKNFLIKENSKIGGAASTTATSQLTSTADSATNQAGQTAGGTSETALKVENKSPEVLKDGKDHGVPTQIAVPHLSSSSPGSSAR